MAGLLKWGPGCYDFPSSIQDVYAEVKRALIQAGHIDGKAGLWLVILDKFDDDTAQRAMEGDMLPVRFMAKRHVPNREVFQQPMSITDFSQNPCICLYSTKPFKCRLPGNIPDSNRVGLSRISISLDPVKTIRYDVPTSSFYLNGVKQ